MRDLDLKESIERRQSVRAFKSDPISDEFVTEALRMAVHAPSAGNLQARDFIVVRDEETKSRLAAAAHDQDFIRTAPVVVVCCANLERIQNYGPRGRDLYCLQDVAASVEHILLYAASQGYGGCWVGAFEESSVSAILGIPRHARPVAMVPMGVPEKEGRRTSRLPLDEVVHKGKW